MLNMSTKRIFIIAGIAVVLMYVIAHYATKEQAAMLGLTKTVTA